jgi:hypothetical protein
MRKKYDIQTLCNTNKKQGKINIYKEKRKLRKANISPEIQKLRKKHTKITAIVLSIIVAISIPLSFIRVVKDHLKIETLCFTDYVGEKYESIEEAELDYYKLKKHITGEQLMYEPMFVMVDEKTGEYNLEVMQIYTEFKKTDKGYKKYKNRLDPEEADISFTFKTKEELNKFIKEATLDSFYEDFSMIDRNITFNDDSLEITYSRASIISDRYFRLPRQFIFLTGEILIILGASALIYKLKIENL